MSSLRSVVGISACLAWFASVEYLPGQSSSLSLVGFDANERPLLRVTGTAGIPYTLEQSMNLSDWFSIFSGVATNGGLDYKAAPVDRRAAFYRARVAPAPLLVQPKLDTNRFGVGLVSTNGGSCEVTALNGTRFRLMVPPKTVAESVAIRMTVITNVTGVPGQGLFPAAVQFEPDGLQFMGAATLQIDFPTNIPVNQVASYSFGNTGAGFYLTPDQVETNRVIIPITHFSCAGCTALTRPQLANFASLSIEDARNQASQTIASQIALARQDGTLTLETIAKAFTSAATKLLQDEILPHLDEAKKNCAVYRTLMPEIYGLDRQSQLLGVPPIPEIAVAESIWCAGLVNCEEEVLQKCEHDGGNTGLLSELLSIERARQLMDESGCPPPPDLMSRMTNCYPLWSGKLTYVATGSTNDPSVPTCIQKWSSEFRFSGIVTNATETDMVFFKLVTLNIEGSSGGQRTFESTCYDQGSCYPSSGSWSEYEHTLEQWAAGGRETATVSWYIYPSGAVQFFGIVFGREVQAPGVVAIQGNSTNCDGVQSSYDTISSVPITLDAFDYSDVTGPAGVTDTSASGSASQTMVEAGGPPSTVTWTWDFHRTQ